MTRIKAGAGFLISGAVFLAVGVGAAAAWGNFLPLGIGAVYLALGVASLMRQKHARGAK